MPTKGTGLVGLQPAPAGIQPVWLGCTYSPLQPTAASSDGTTEDDDLLKTIQDANKKVMDKLSAISRALLVLFGTGDGAIAESTQYPDIQDGNGHDCAVQGQRFSTIIHDHPLALTGKLIDDLENQRIIFSAARIGPSLARMRFISTLFACIGPRTAI